MSGHNYYSFSLNLNELMNDKIDLEYQYKSKLKQYCLSRFYQTFLNKYNIACINDIALVNKDELTSIEDDIFAFGKNKLKQRHFQMFIRQVTCHEDYKIGMYKKIAPKYHPHKNKKKETNDKKEDENDKKEEDSISQSNVSLISQHGYIY